MPRVEFRTVARPLAWALALSYTTAFLVAAVLYHQASDRTEPTFREWSESSEDSLYEGLSDPLAIAVLVTGFDPETMILSLRLLPQPVGDLGGSLGAGSAWYLYEIDLELVVNSVSGLSEGPSVAGYFEGHPDVFIPYSSIDVQLDIVMDAGYRTRPSTRWYPFDTYAHDLRVFGASRPWSEDTLVPGTDSTFLLDWQEIGVAPYAYSAPVGGFHYRFRPGSTSGWEAGQTQDVDAVLSDWADGGASFEIYVQRTLGVKLLVGLVSLALFLNLLAVTYLTARVVSTERPPSAQVLIWVAALSFAAVAIRDTMPFAPPPGVMLDYLFFFPTLLTASIATVVLVFTWSRRSDFVA